MTTVVSPLPIPFGWFQVGWPSDVAAGSVRPQLGDPALTAVIGDGFIDVLTEQIGEDARIWEHKTYLDRPALSDADGPIMGFRSWAQQFYADSGAPA